MYHVIVIFITNNDNFIQNLSWTLFVNIKNAKIVKDIYLYYLDKDKEKHHKVS